MKDKFQKAQKKSAGLTKSVQGFVLLRGEIEIQNKTINELKRSNAALVAKNGKLQSENDQLEEINAKLQSEKEEWYKDELIENSKFGKKTLDEEIKNSKFSKKEYSVASDEKKKKPPISDMIIFNSGYHHNPVKMLGPMDVSTVSIDSEEFIHT